MASFGKHVILTHANLNEVHHLPAPTTVPATRTSRCPAGMSTASFLVPSIPEVCRPPPPAEAESWGTRTAFFDFGLKNALSTLPENPRRAYNRIVVDNMTENRFNATSHQTATMEAVMSSSTGRTHLNKIDPNSFGIRATKFHDTRWNTNWSLSQGERRSRRTTPWKVNALPDWPLMAVMVEHVAGSRDWVVTKSVWHLNDEEIKNVYTMYIMFTCWGCCFFASMKDPFYDGESYRKDGGDGSVNWIYDKQEDIEEQARAELWREELIEEIEKKVGGLRELEEAKKEELVK